MIKINVVYSVISCGIFLFIYPSLYHCYYYYFKPNLQIMLKTKPNQVLLQNIEHQKAQSISKENIFDNPARLYLMIKSIYQNYKKDNVLQLMQERVFQVKVDKTDETIQLNKVSACSLFTYHKLVEEDLILLIKMKELVKIQMKRQLEQQIWKGIQKLQSVGSIMHCYKILLGLQFLKGDMSMYDFIEDLMISKLITMKLQPQDFNTIATYILGLPKIGQTIIVLISKLYQKLQRIQDFHRLYQIFKHHFPQTNTNSPVNTQYLEALMRISLPQTLEIIVKMVQANNQSSTLVLQLAQTEAKYKLMTMQLIMTDKTKYILNFIVQVVKFGRPIWYEIIEWQHKAAQEPKNFLKDSLEGILIGMLKDNRKYDIVISIIQKITEIDEHSQIGLIFVRQLLKLQQRGYLGHKIIRRFLAIKILKYNSCEQYVHQIFSSGFKFVQVILEMFNFQSNVLNFYLHIINHQEYVKLLQNYLKELAEKMPTKYKEFYMRCNCIDKLEKDHPFTNTINVLLKIMADNVTLEVAINLIRDFALIPPSKYLLGILGKLLVLFKENKQLNILKTQIIRTLNIILIKTPKEQINYAIKINLPLFLKQNFRNESSQIFENVPEETNVYLKRIYQEFLSRKRL